MTHRYSGEFITFSNGQKGFVVDSYKKQKLKLKVKAVKVLSCEDWKTNLVHPKPEIPVDTILEVTTMTNCYGKYLEAYYKDRHYYIKPSRVEFLEEIEETV